MGPSKQGRSKYAGMRAAALVRLTADSNGGSYVSHVCDEANRVLRSIHWLQPARRRSFDSVKFQSRGSLRTPRPTNSLDTRSYSIVRRALAHS
jgi:hypothetical protein